MQMHSSPISTTVCELYRQIATWRCDFCSGGGGGGSGAGGLIGSSASVLVDDSPRAITAR